MTRGDIRTEILVRMGKDTTSAWTSEPILNDWINQAHKWAAGYKKWPFTEGRASTTFASLASSTDGYLAGSYPEGWKSDSIRMLTIDGKRVKKTDFYKFQSFLQDNSSSSERIFSDFGRLYYINPRIDISGSVVAWGQYTPADIDDGDGNDTTETVFVGEDEGNQAIIEEALSYALKRDNRVKESIEHHNIAKVHLEEVYKRIADEQFGYQSTKDDGMFERFDVLEGGFRDEIFKRDQF